MSEPIKAYFAQALRGNSQWWTWLAGFWFAMVIWVFGSGLLGVPMLIFMAKAENPDLGFAAFLDQDAMQALMTKFSAGVTQAPSTLDNLLAQSIFVLPFPVLLIWLLRKRLSGAAKTIAIAIAASCILISFVGIIAQLTGQPPEAGKLMTDFIPKSAGVYASMLLTFPPLIFGLWLVVKFIHGRSFKTMMTAHTHFRWGRVVQSMLVFWAIAGALTAAAHVMGFNKVEGVFDGSRFFLYAGLSLLLIPLQSATEEIMLRGYMNQGLGKYIRNPWIVFFITSALFASLHLGNPEAAEGANSGKLLVTMSGYFMFGMFACVLTYIDGGLESAIGVHAANNLYASILLGYDNSALPTPTVFKTGLNADTDLIFTMLTLGLVCLVLWKFRKPLIVDTSGLNAETFS